MKNNILLSLVFLLCLLLVACGERQDQTIFVYGSLREGFHNYEKYLSGKIVNIEPGIVKGRLFHIADRGYPALLEGADDVHGEIIVVKGKYSNIVEELDELEEYFGEDNIENEYNRKHVEVLNTKTGKTDKLPVYFFNMKNPEVDPSELIPILHGDWKEYMKENPKKKMEK